MTKSLPTRHLREHPDLDQLKRQAKELLQEFISGEQDAIAEVKTHYHDSDPATFALHHAQLVIARAYGFDSWPKLKAYVDGVNIKRLADAVQANDLQQVRAMLNSRPELVNMQMAYRDERRPIHFAILGRLPEMTRLLMQHGADARQGIYPHRDATSALTLATERGYDEIVTIIRIEEENRKPDESDKNDAQPTTTVESIPEETTARSAVVRGDAEWLRARHLEGKLVNQIDWGNGGLLTAAVDNDQPEILKMLLDFGFDPNEKVRLNEVENPYYSQAFPLWHAAAQGKTEMAETLLKYRADPNAHVDSAGSSVYSAYSHRQWKMVDLLKVYGGKLTPDIVGIYRETETARQMFADAKEEDERKALAEEIIKFAASGGDPEIVRMALDNIDWTLDYWRWFWILGEPTYFWHHIPWLYAGNKTFDRGTYIICFRLVLERCGPNVIGRFNRTMLHVVASMRDHITDEEVAEFAKALLDAGAQTDIRDEILKSTPLGWACRWGRIPVVKLLLEYRADPIEADAEPWATPRAWAEKMRRPDILDLLK
ncbi:MAG TPA: ankyrin repeat domain-containing protein [Blastocatellia bacterium]|nr:ankyrin repeat domain-containing protein [Blastocatellia bacterium]